MLEKPQINDDFLINCLNEKYDKKIQSVTFLPLGADVDTAVYKAQVTGSIFYFVKLRRGSINESSVEVPTFLSENSLKQVISTLRTLDGNLRCNLNQTWSITLHPYVDGHHGYANKMTPSQWIEFGSALKCLHETSFPKNIIKNIPCEEFSASWHKEIQSAFTHIEKETFKDSIAIELAEFFKNQKSEIFKLIDKVEKTVVSLKNKKHEFVLCHADIHCWNLLIESKSENLFIVDWDTLVFAPRERDLMFIGAGLADSGYTSSQEIEMFFKGYGHQTVDLDTISYYRCMRILEDLVAYYRQVFLSNEGEEDRKQAIEYVKSNFRDNGSIAMALI